MTASLPKNVLVTGLGKTGLSAVRYLVGQGCDAHVADTRDNPPGLEELRALYPDIPVHVGDMDSLNLTGVDMIVVSPGVSVKTPMFAKAAESGIELVGDVELFLRANSKPVIAITGSNGKSTVTELTTAILNDAGKKAVAAGNIGLPVLDLLDAADYDVAVLELSSFQLETTHSLNSAAAVVLNVSEDHMDRYESLAEYAAAKAVVYQAGKRLVLNRDDAVVMAMARNDAAEIVSFGLTKPQNDADYGRADVNDELWLLKGEQKLLPVSKLSMPGAHNQTNVLASIALAEALGVSPRVAAQTASGFTGLSHRCKLVASVSDVLWINDSKATNVGATVAALEGLNRPLILIAGGEGKGADFTPLKPAVKSCAKLVILFGKDKQVLSDTLAGSVPVHLVNDMAEAVDLAAKQAVPGDIVMLSPACASLDMYRNFAERGEHFETLVEGLQT